MLADNASVYSPADAQGHVSDQGLFKVTSTVGSRAKKAATQQQTLIGVAALVALLWFFGRKK